MTALPRPGLSDLSLSPDPALLSDEVRQCCECIDGASVRSRDSGTAPQPPAPAPAPRWSEERGASGITRLTPSDGAYRVPAPTLASSSPPGLPARPFTSWFQEHVWVLPALCVPEAVLSVHPPAAFLGEDSGVAGWDEEASCAGPAVAWPSRVRRELRVQSPPEESPDLEHLGDCSPDCAPGCSACRRWYWDRMAAFQASSPYRSRCPHPLPPAAGKVGGGRGRAGRRAAQTTASPQRRAVGDSSRSNGPGRGGGGGGCGGRTSGTGSGLPPSPALQASWSLLEPTPG